MSQVDIECLLKKAMGLNTPSIGSTTIQRAVRLRMAALGLSQEDDYQEQLRTSIDELQELIETVVVPETWFFRDPEAFGTLARLTAETWRSNPAAGTIRLLSVPCSTGEEPYSMAMSLLEAGFSPQQFQVDAVDISARALAYANSGVYGPNSFRSASPAFRDRYFQPTADRYTVVEGLRAIVTFRQCNVLSLEASYCKELYDVIFCRNLLIYFDRPTQERVMKTMELLLKPGGLLFVGPAEAFLASCSGFTAVNQAMSFAFKRTGKPFAKPEVFRTESKKPAEKPNTRRPRLMAATVPVSPSASNPYQPAPVSLETARRMADDGRLKDAAAWCQTNLLEQGPSAETYHLLGLIRDAVGDQAGALELYRKVIYLDPDHIEGLMHLALVTEKQGDKAAAERFRERARRVERRTKEKAS